MLGNVLAWDSTRELVWPVAACWYGALMFIIASIASATQQGIMLQRFATHPDYLRRLRSLLGRGRNPRPVQIFVWQVPVMMLRFGIYLLLIGLLIHLWHPVVGDRESSPDRLKVGGFSTNGARIRVLTVSRLLYSSPRLLHSHILAILCL